MSDFWTEWNAWSESTRGFHRDAFWYACGRRDAGGRLDPFAFATTFAQRAHSHDIHETSYRPSIQDAYRVAEVIL